MASDVGAVDVEAPAGDIDMQGLLLSTLRKREVPQQGRRRTDDRGRGWANQQQRINAVGECVVTCRESGAAGGCPPVARGK